MTEFNLDMTKALSEISNDIDNSEIIIKTLQNKIVDLEKLLKEKDDIVKKYEEIVVLYRRAIQYLSYSQTKDNSLL